MEIDYFHMIKIQKYFKLYTSSQVTQIISFKMLLFSIALLPLYIYFALLYFSLTSCMLNYLKCLESLQISLQL